jgi:pimeloyl-ACP methyl ester carboxylesterase
MTTDMTLAVEQRLTHLFQHFGLTQVHVAARSIGDWQGLATTQPDRIASLTLICPQAIDVSALRALASRCLLITGDHGPAFERIHGTMSALAEATHMALPAYSGLIWDDAIADHTASIGTDMMAFLRRIDHQQRTTPVTLPAPAGEHAGLFYRTHGAGPPHRKSAGE